MRGRIILQDLVSHHYLTAEGVWATSCQDARVFEHTYMALLAGLDYRDKPSQVVWCFRNPSANMYLPVHPCDNDRVYPCVTCPLMSPVQNAEPCLNTFGS